MLDDLVISTVSIICMSGDMQQGKKRKRKNIDPSRDSNHTPSAIRADVLSQLD